MTNLPLITEAIQLEGVIDFLKSMRKKKETETLDPLTKDQITLIKTVFPGVNYLSKWSGTGVKDGDDKNAWANTPTKGIAFRNKNGTLMASVGHYKAGQNKMTTPPIIHTDHEIKSEDDLEKLNEEIGKPKHIQLEKGLSHEEAMKLAPWKKSYGDCRGFSYDKKTGIATWI